MVRVRRRHPTELTGPCSVRRAENRRPSFVCQTRRHPDSGRKFIKKGHAQIQNGRAAGNVCAFILAPCIPSRRLTAETRARLGLLIMAILVAPAQTLFGSNLAKGPFIIFLFNDGPFVRFSARVHVNFVGGGLDHAPLVPQDASGRPLQGDG